jgi:H-type lectin domain
MKKLVLTSALLFLLAFTASTFAQSQVESGTFGVNSKTPNYTLNKNSGDRSVTVEVNFTKPFESKPDVVLSVTQMDANTSSNLRYDVEPVSISRDGFTIKITTWADCTINSIRGTWLAHAE